MANLFKWGGGAGVVVGPTGPVVRNITINTYSSNSGFGFSFSVAYQDADGNLQAYYWEPTAAGSTQTWNFDALDGVFTCSVPFSSSGGLTVTSGETEIESDTSASFYFYAVRANTDVIAELKYS